MSGAEDGRRVLYVGKIDEARGGDEGADQALVQQPALIVQDRAHIDRAVGAEPGPDHPVPHRPVFDRRVANHDRDHVVADLPVSERLVIVAKRLDVGDHPASRLLRMLAGLGVPRTRPRRSPSPRNWPASTSDFRTTRTLKPKPLRSEPLSATTTTGRPRRMALNRVGLGAPLAISSRPDPSSAIWSAPTPNRSSERSRPCALKYPFSRAMKIP